MHTVNNGALERLRRSLDAWGRGAWEAQPLKGGANSRLYLLSGADKPELCAKVFQEEENGKPPLRYGREKAFYAVAPGTAAEYMPRSVRWDDERSVAFLEYVDGHPVTEVSSADVEQAGVFVLRLQGADMQKLGFASDACRTWEAHAGIVDARLRHLSGMSAADELASAALGFVNTEMRDAWKVVCREAMRGANADPFIPVVSPSDFGFHNVLRRRDASLCFFDFEHAGLDDPAKLVCDFFTRPAAGILEDDFDVFCEAARFDGSIRSRARRLMNLHRIKWACIVLNEFTAEGSRRRRFSGGECADRREEQLAKARALVSRALQP